MLSPNDCHNNFSTATHDKTSIELNVNNAFHGNDARNRSESIPEPLYYPLGPKCNQKFQSFQEFLIEITKVLGQRQSFYTLDFADILWKIQQWKNNLPQVELFYAVKANPDPLLLKLLVLMKTSFDCATEGEIRAVLKAGASSKSILWAHTVKPVDGLLYARSVGVDMMTFDNEEELLKIHKIFPVARLILRIRPSEVKCKFDLSGKFGCSVSEAMTLLDQAKRLNMNVIGISFHVGALCTEPHCFTSTIRDCREVFDHARNIGLHPSILDIGGGFFGAAGTEKIFNKITGRIKDALEKYFSNKEVRVIAEPGCFIVGSAMNLVCTIIGKRSIRDNEQVRKHYFLNNGIYGSFFRDIEFYGIRTKPLLSQSELETRTAYESTLFGQTCCSEDVIQNSIQLPDMKVGECLLWENMGAYSSALCGTFCGVPLPFTVYVFKENDRLPPSEVDQYENAMELMRKHAIFIEKNETSII